MTPTTKIVLGVLGGGSAAVAGNEIYAKSTGKAGIFVAEAKENVQDATLPQELSNTDKINKLLETWKSCTLKIRVKNGSENQDFGVIQEEASLGTLLTKLQESSYNSCASELTEGNTKKLIVLKDTDSGWQEMTEKEHIQELVKGWNNKCTIQVKSSTGNSFSYTSVLEVSTDQRLVGLYKELVKLSTDCSDSNTNKTKIFKNTSGDLWSEVTVQEQIKDLVSSNGFGCTIQITVDNDATPKDWETVVTEQADQEKLLAKLNSLKSDKCATATTKTTLVLHKTPEGGSAVYQTDKERVEAWIGKTAGFKEENKKCVLRIRVGEKNEDIKDGQDLSGLPAFLSGESFKTDCASSADSQTPKNIVVQKIGSTWSIYPTLKQQIKDLKTELESKCTLTIQDSSGGSSTLDVDSITVTESLNNLLTKLNGVKSSCLSVETGKSKNITIKKPASGSNDWNVEIKDS